MKNINEIKERILELPSGYISEKIISNKKYYYLKYYDNGIQKSDYIKSNELERIRKEIKERKELEKIIKEYDSNKRNMPTLSNNAKNLTGSLMMEDVVVAKFKDGNIVFKNGELCPLIINRTNSISNFLKGRVIDQNRTNSRLLKKVLGINNTDERLISLYAYGAVITDNYWFKPKGSKIKYKDICFDADYYSDLSLNGELMFYPKSPKHSPQITTIGSFEKCWKLINNEWWLYKNQSKEQIFSEILSSLVASKLNIPTATYEYDNGYIKTKNFATKYNFDPMIGLTEDESYENIFNKLFEINEKLADQYLLLSFFDCVVNNIDRHNENLGFLRSKKTGKIICLAPNFDNNLALLGYDKNLRMEPNKDGFIKMFVDFLKKNPVACTRMKNIVIATISKQDIKYCIDAVPIKMDEYNIEKYIIDRYEYLINTINKL